MIVLAVVALIYLEDAVNFISTRSTADAGHANVEQLARQNAALRKQQASLSNPVTIKHDARVLGMVQQGEQPYVMMGLPSH